jgi:hypothetical protein
MAKIAVFGFLYGYIYILMARTLRAEPSALLIAIRFCPGASRQSIKRLQRAAVPASKLACTSAADPQRRWSASGT